MSLFFCISPNFLFLPVSLYLAFTGDVESEAVVGLSKVAPPADLLSSPSLLCPAPHPSPSPPDEAGALLMILDLAASLTASLGLVAQDKDKALVYQNLSLALQVAQVSELQILYVQLCNYTITAVQTRLSVGQGYLKTHSLRRNRNVIS